MSILSAVTTGKQVGAQIHTIAGNNGVGKTTWAASFPKPLIIDLEDGSKHIDVSRLPANKFPNLAAYRATIKELIESNHGFQTVVTDSVESLEGLICDAVCAEGKVDSIEKYDGGYGKGYVRTREITRDIFTDFRTLQSKGITVILVAHTQVKSHNDPLTNTQWDRVIMRCNDKMAALIRDLSDNVFFASYKVFTTKENGKMKAFGDGQRVMFTQWRSAFDAKNRLGLPLEIPLSYEAFKDACEKQEDADPKLLVADIEDMVATLDPTLKAQVATQIEKFRSNSTKLQEIKTRLMKYVAA